jgi:NAD(P)-dependent dehydrogenase (short-subunit alcohol dehydrogenase family)
VPFDRLRAQFHARSGHMITSQLVAQIPVGRGGNVHDVADLITFLCREESGYITGVTYDVNGGSHIH